MTNMFEYLAWRGDLTFSQAPFNPVDNVILSQLSYLPLDNIVPGPDEKSECDIALAAELFQEKYDKNVLDIRSHVLFQEKDPALIRELGLCQRFKNCRLSGYVNIIDFNRELQFSAVCIGIDKDRTFIAFRGTDLTLVGWKEDFNMGFKEVIPAQQEAVIYLEKMASRIKGSLYLGGHSKGGNLAIFASANCDKKIQKRIAAIYSNDSPGFQEKFIKSEGYAAIKDRIHSFVPQSSIIGMLFEHGCDYHVIKSSKIGLLQHELYSWEVSYNDMIPVDDITTGSRFVSKTFKEWVSTLDNEKRELFCNALYSILLASEAKSLSDLEKSWFTAAGRMIKSFGNIDKETKNFLGETMKELFNTAKRNVILLKNEKDLVQGIN
jgi:hypothetical protein